VRAIVINRNGGPEVLELEDRPAPEPGPGQLLVDVGAIGVNFRDIYEREGTIPPPPPVIAGIEGAGTVAAVGEGVGGVSVGDRVCWKDQQGSYAEQALVATSSAVPVPDGISHEVAGAAILQGMTAHYLTTSTYPIKEGETALVEAAAGGVGRLLVQMVKMRGGRVIGTTSTDEKAEIARAAGADEVIPYEGFAERARELTGGEGVHVVYDGVGQATVDEGLNALRPRGMMASFGRSSGPVPPFELFRLFAGGSLFITQASLMHYTATREELLWRAGDVFGWIRDGKLDIHLGGRYPLEQAREAQEALQGRRTTGKLVLLPGGAS
jgi:NADPH2:quinone reductase